MSASQPPGVRASGPAGRLAGAFLHSKLTPLTIEASVFLGLFAFATLPREEEPQIRVPMVDVRVAWPGSEPAEVAKRVVEPIERAMWSVSQVEHVYATAQHGFALVTVRFKVGESNEHSLLPVNVLVLCKVRSGSGRLVHCMYNHAPMRIHQLRFLRAIKTPLTDK